MSSEVGGRGKKGWCSSCWGKLYFKLGRLKTTAIEAQADFEKDIKFDV